MVEDDRPLAEILWANSAALKLRVARAQETMHQTAAQAAGIAERANIGLLALTHLSNRYFGPEIAREAREIFPDTVVPKDFDVVEVPFAERGTPQLVKGGALHRPEPEAVSSAPQ